jgi:hypothetical protein
MQESYFIQLAKFLESERSTKTIFPPPEHVFSQLNLCPFDKVEVVILGQDPYALRHQEYRAQSQQTRWSDEVILRADHRVHTTTQISRTRTSARARVLGGAGRHAAALAQKRL